MAKRYHFFNMYLTTTVSVALVLFLLGIEVILMLSTHNLMRQVKENVSLTLVLNDDADSTQIARLNNLLQVASFVHAYTYISKEQALQEHTVNLGEDPTTFLGFNPLQAAYEVNLNAAYAQADSIEMISQKLSIFPCISTISYPKDVVTLLDGNMGKISMLLLGIAAVLLIVALALIINTIRLYIYSKRFLINTMKLVGATPWVIKRPLIGRNIWMGLVASMLALCLLVGVFYYCHNQLGIVMFPLTYVNIGIVCGVVVLSGIIITGFAALIASNKYIRMKTDDLYYV